MKSVFAKKSIPDPELRILKEELLIAQGDLAQAYHQFDQAVENWEKALELDPESEILRRKVEYKTYFNE